MVRQTIGSIAVTVAIELGVAGCAAGGYHDDGPCPLHPGDRSATTDEIDAAAALAFDDSKSQALSAVARRPGLTSAEQEHLVCVTFRAVTFDDSRLKVLTALIRNPEFSPRAKS